MRHAIVAAMLLGGAQSAVWGQTAPAPEPAADTAEPVAAPAGNRPASDLPIADLSDPDLIYDPESDTYYDPQTGDVFAAPAPAPVDPNAPQVPSGQQVPIPTNFGPLQTGIYAGAGLNTFDVEAYGIHGMVGYDFNKNFGVEAQIGLGIADDEEFIDGVGIPLRGGTGGVTRTVPEEVLSSSGYDASFAAFGVVRAPIGDKIEVFARGGVHSTGLGGQIAGRVRNADFGPALQGQVFLFDYDTNATGFAVGGGVQYNFGDFDLQAIRLDFTYFDFGDLDEASINNIEGDQPVDGDILGGGLRFIDGGAFLSASLVQRF